MNNKILYFHLFGSCVYYVLLSQFPLLASLWMSDTHNILPLAALLSSCTFIPMAFFMVSVYFIFGFPLFLLPSIFPSIIVFSKTPSLLMMCLHKDNFSFVIFVSSNVLGLIYSGIYLLIFLAVQSICRALFLPHISDDSFFFLLAFFTIQLLHLYIVKYKGVVDLNLGL